MPDTPERLYFAYGSNINLGQAVDGTYRPDSDGSTAIVTDAAGKAKIMYLPKGNYTLRETAPAGYSLQSDASINLMGKSTVTVMNEPLKYMPEAQKSRLIFSEIKRLYIFSIRQLRSDTKKNKIIFLKVDDNRFNVFRV